MRMRFVPTLSFHHDKSMVTGSRIDELLNQIEREDEARNELSRPRPFTATRTSARPRIRQAQHPLVVCHVDPDGDAIGSLLGVGWVLEALGIPHRLACASPEPSKMRFLPRSRPLETSAGDGHDLVIALDCNSLDRLGSIATDARWSVCRS